MSKVNLVPVSGAYNITAMNSNFDKIAKELNEKVFYRDNPDNEPNQLVNDLDLNEKRIYNLPVPILDHEPARFAEVKVLPELAAQALANAQSSAASAATATQQAMIATVKADEASTSASSALASQGASLASAGQAAASASAASDSEVDALASQVAALASENDAEIAAAAAQASQGVATAQATIATTKAGEASASAASALTQANTATTQAGIATSQAGIATAQAVIATDAANSIDEAFLLNRANHTGTQAQSTVVGLTADIAALQARQLPLGQGQTYKTISPTLGTWYTNSTGRTIRVGMQGTVSAAVGGIEIFVNQPTPLRIGFEMDSLDRIVAANAIIPSSGTYRFTAADVGSLSFWELS